MIIRDARADDASRLSELNYFFNGVCVDPTHIVARMGNEAELIAVAEDVGRLIGFVCGQVLRSFCYIRPVLKITELYVEECRRGGGIGLMLIAYIENKAKEMDVEEIRLETGEDNIRAQNVYAKAGYVRSREVSFLKLLR